MTAHADVTETIESDGTPRRDVGYEINDGILQSIFRDRDCFRTWGVQCPHYDDETVIVVDDKRLWSPRNRFDPVPKKLTTIVIGIELRLRAFRVAKQPIWTVFRVFTTRRDR